MTGKKLTQGRLKELLHYDPDTGDFIWLVDSGPGRPCSGDIAGCVSKIHGYRYINVDGKPYRASRLSFLYMEGYFPEYQVDHRDLVRDNNKWKNLRHVTPSCNSRNCKVRKNNNSGVTGVSWHKVSKQWYSNIMAGGRFVYLGCSKDLIESVKLRWEAEKKYGYPSCQTTSSAYLYLKDNGIVK